MPPTGNFMRFTDDGNLIPLAVEPLNDGSGRFALSATSGSASGGTTISTSGSPVGPSNPLYILGIVGGKTVETSDEFSRVADTNVYAVGDVISATVSDTGTTPLRSIVVGASNGATGYLTKFRLMTSGSSCVAVVRAHFYTVTAPTTVIPGDNVAMGLAYANRSQRIGAIDFPALATELGTSSAARAQDLTTRLAFQCDPGDNKIYYRLETQTVFTPASSQAFFIALTSERNGS